jgi:hypothetical protein
MECVHDIYGVRVVHGLYGVLAMVLPMMPGEFGGTGGVWSSNMCRLAKSGLSTPKGSGLAYSIHIVCSWSSRCHNVDAGYGAWSQGMLGL